MTDGRKSIQVLVLNTFAFTVCFAAWMMNGVLVTFLVDNGLYHWDKAQIGWLIGIPVLTGSITRLPVGVLTDRFGGRIVYTILMLLAAGAMWLVSMADSFATFILASLGFGLSGASFAVGIAYTSVWFSKERQGTALGIFGAGNAGAAITSMVAPTVLRALTSGEAGLEGWRQLPRIYAAALAVTAVLFWFLTYSKRVADAETRTIRDRLKPLGNIRVWRFGLYYFLVFGGFVALAQWLVPYYVNVYTLSLTAAGMMASIFTLPSGVIRALGGWLSDRFGARAVMYFVLATCIITSALLIVPRMDVQAPGEGVMAVKPGTVEAVSEQAIVVDGHRYTLRPKPADTMGLTSDPGLLVLPHFESWQQPVVEAGAKVKRKELLARGITHIYFQANVWIFTALVFVLGIAMGIGKAAVYKHIPDYFPNDVGVVGGIVGVLGGLGGFVGPIVFGYLLKWTGIWTTCWMFFFALSAVCLIWMHVTVRGIMRRRAPGLLHQIEHSGVDDLPNGGIPGGKA